LGKNQYRVFFAHHAVSFFIKQNMALFLLYAKRNIAFLFGVAIRGYTPLGFGGAIFCPLTYFGWLESILRIFEDIGYKL